MKRRYWLFVLGTVAVFLALAGTRGADIVETGRRVYAENCASCHGLSLEGGNPAAPLSRGVNGQYPAPPHDSTGHTWHHPDAQLKQIVAEGSFYPDFASAMPAFGEKLSEADIDAVLAYIKTGWTEEQRGFQEEVTRAYSRQFQQANTPAP